MTVVSNTSPIINLAATGWLDILQKLYGRLAIPKAVYHEVVFKGAGQAGAAELPTLQWIVPHQVVDLMFVASLRSELDEGEAEAIALGIQLKAELLLLDESRGRAVASRLGLKFTGLLGVLLSAKHQGFIPSVKIQLDDIIAKAGFWVSEKVYAHALRLAGE